MPTVKLSIGDVLDRISIAELKYEAIIFTHKASCDSDAAISRASHLLDLLSGLVEHLTNDCTESETSYAFKALDELRKINRRLWTAEDQLRCCEPKAHIDWAMHIAELNDERSKIKAAIDNLFGFGADNKTYGSNNADINHT